MLTINASIYFKKYEEGGLSKNGVSGMQPSFSVNDDLIMCKILGKDGTSKFILGREYDVTIDLPYGEEFSDKIKSGYRFHLNFGGHEFAAGVVT